MKKTIILMICFITVILTFSCKNDKKLDIIQDKKFAQILIKIHEADAILKNQSKYDAKLKNPATQSYYNQIFAEYNVSREEFDYSLKYYIKHFEKFVSIENIVIDSLNKKYNYLDSLDKIGLEKNDIWTLKKEWDLPTDGSTNPIPFKYYTDKNGTYTLTAKIFVYDDDMSKDLKMKITAFYTDSTKDNRIIRIRKGTMKWDDYTLSLHTNPQKQLLYIKGNVLDHAISTTYMHIKVKEILLIYKPDRHYNHI